MAGELSDQGQKIDHLQIDQREKPPPLPEALVDHGGMPFSRGNTQAHYHLLNEIGDGQQENQQP
jgi:hypothetical protein